ncbi:MAG TPA: DUF2279 domain-containing protein [Kofleriaceae bacterium]
MRPGLIALIIVTWLHGVALAGPQASETPSHDQDGAVTAPKDSPWIDLAPAKVLSSPSRDEHTHDHRLASGITLASLYAGFWGWAYIAWYRNHPLKEEHDIGADGWFGVNTYAGGADKLGHAWATMTLARGGTALLDKGGWKRWHAALISAAMSELLFFGVEVKDYYYYEFSPGDFTFNTLGALSAVALDLSPRLDELIDFRVEWWPSKQFRYNLTNADSPCAKHTPGQPSCSRLNVAEDYSGETYLLALHLGAIRPLRDMKYGTWSKFVDVAVGFETRNYKPPPTLLMEQEPEVVRRQTLFLGVTFNAQGLIDHLLDHESKLRKVGHGVLEVLTPPWTRVVPSHIDSTRTTADPHMGGA